MICDAPDGLKRTEVPLVIVYDKKIVAKKQVVRLSKVMENAMPRVLDSSRIRISLLVM